MEKVGGMLKNEKLEQKGSEKREQAGFGSSDQYANQGGQGDYGGDQSNY